MKGRWPTGLVVAIVSCAGLVLAAPAAAMTVDSTADEGSGCTLRTAVEAVDAGNGGGPCGGLASGGLTPIELPAGHYTLTHGELPVTVGAELRIVGADGADPGATTIDGDELGRVLKVASGAVVILQNVEVTGGITFNGLDATAAEGFGGEVQPGGGILNEGNLTLVHTIITGNHTGRGGDGGGGAATPTHHNGGGANNGGDGGGIYNAPHALLELLGSTITGNQTGAGGTGGTGGHGLAGIGNIAAGGDGGIGGHSGSGGGIYNAEHATLVIGMSTISGNHTGRDGQGGDGGEGADDAPMTGVGTGGWGGTGGNSSLLFSGGGLPTYSEYSGGGGIYNGGALTMTKSTISGNTTGAGGLGGEPGLGGERASPSSGRQTSGKAGEGGSAGLGAGLMNYVASSSSLTDVTIYGNTTGDGGHGAAGAQSSSRGGGPGGFGGNGGGIWASSGGNALTLNFVTISANEVGAVGEGGEDAIDPGIPGERGKGPAIATGPHSGGEGVHVADSIFDANGIDGIDFECSEASSGSGDIHAGADNVAYPDDSCPGTVEDPKLGSLANNGGTTETMLPGTGSAAIALVPLASCNVSEDQRGAARPAAGKSGCDAGAVETAGSGGSPISQTITFPQPAGHTVGDADFAPGATASSGLTVSYVSLTTAVCTIVAGKIHLVAAGACTVKAEQAGNSEYATATPVERSFQVAAASSGGGGGGGGGETPSGGSSGTPPGGGGSSGGGGSGPGGGPTTSKASAGGVKVGGTRVTVPITCAGPTACVIKVVLTEGRKKKSIGTTTVTIPAGTTKKVTVALDAAGKALLKNLTSLKGTLTVTENGQPTPVATRPFKVSLKN